MIVKKSVALHPIMDQYVRKTWAVLIDLGYDASYSTVLNYMLLTAIGMVMNNSIDEETKILLNGFLNDQETIEALTFEGALTKIRNILTSKFD